MADAQHFNVYWRQIKQSTFMYGARLQFKSGGALYYNRLMPSGTVIHEWYMHTNFYTDRAFPTLPFLKKGVTYHFKFHVTSTPANTIYFKIIFLKRNGTEAASYIAKDYEIDIEMPEDAYEYQVQMVNAAMESLHFKRIEIIPEEKVVAASHPADTLEALRQKGGG
ncbi:accessory Sec system protein Asp3 [Staphylococcus carnosus]|uniref:accessory Sec system protein Asp3 n=1 Tax=Staphylococcus carnosus TaxID=1281 RepID=UPI00081A52F2|nr:accessory Sec system protein Asp3 [Staphylococcus carnosus]ANZ32367.1 accessory Sec system protein Asp3 [Staphylococcus carnosus]UTB79727.1 accessory Sec system protein Asp3 [Staphylococcus carnosus]UTB84494.1 accessory Sec system protein Asp3 [Staphylococcus carnosus]